jgi:hypothetical protein
MHSAFMSVRPETSQEKTPSGFPAICPVENSSDGELLPGHQTARFRQVAAVSRPPPELCGVWWPLAEFEHSPTEMPLFFEFSLCLSRACLVK